MRKEIVDKDTGKVVKRFFFGYGEMVYDPKRVCLYSITRIVLNIAFLVIVWCITSAYIRDKTSTLNVSTIVGDASIYPQNTYNELVSIAESNKGKFKVDFEFIQADSFAPISEPTTVTIYKYEDGVYKVSVNENFFGYVGDEFSFTDKGDMEDAILNKISQKQIVDAYSSTCKLMDRYSDIYRNYVDYQISIWYRFSCVVIVLFCYILVSFMAALFRLPEERTYTSYIVSTVPYFIYFVLYSAWFSITKKHERKKERKSKEVKNKNNSSLDSENVIDDLQDALGWYNKIIHAFRSISDNDNIHPLLLIMDKLNGYYKQTDTEDGHSFYSVYCKGLYDTLVEIRNQVNRGILTKSDEAKAVIDTCKLYITIFNSLWERIVEREKVKTENYEISNKAMEEFAKSMGHLPSKKDFENFSKSP